MTRWQCAALGYITGALLTTCACLGAIAHETIRRK